MERVARLFDANATAVRRGGRDAFADRVVAGEARAADLAARTAVVGVVEEADTLAAAVDLAVRGAAVVAVSAATTGGARARETDLTVCALAAFEKNPYSVVLVDLQMPEVDGMRLTAHLRSLDASDQTPIIVMTAAGGPGEWKRLSQIGADAFLVKPVAFEDVAMQITRTMKSRHRKT